MSRAIEASAGQLGDNAWSPAATATRDAQAPILTWEQARARAREAGDPLPTVTRHFTRTLGHALAHPLKALTDLPPYAISAMDGWAVSGTGPWTLQHAGVMTGGQPMPLTEGTAVLIATGTRVPAGATAVLRLESGEIHRDGMLHARSSDSVTTGRNIRPPGEECRSGDALLPSGATVTPAVLGLAAAVGCDQLVVHCRPTIELLVLGDELLETGQPRDGRVRDAIGPMLPLWLHGYGTDVTGHLRVADDFWLLRNAVERSSSDVVITTGSTASGPKDFVHDVLSDLGARLLIDSVAVHPGHPMLLAELPLGEHGRPRFLVGLPGNPLAAVAGLVTLASPLLRRLGGHADAHRRRLPAAVPFSGHPRATRLVPVAVNDHGLTPLPFRGPAMLRGLALADGLAAVPNGGVAAGTPIEVLEVPGP